MRKLIIATIIVLLAAGQASAYYIPAEHRGEISPYPNTPELYGLFSKYQGEKWGSDGLLQMAMQETNNGRIADLHVVMRLKYKVGQ